MHIAHLGEPEPPPDLARPETAPLVAVLPKVANDVRLLQEEPHGVGELKLGAEERGLFARGGEEAGEALADEAGDVVAVEVVFRDCLQVDWGGSGAGRGRGE